MSLIEIIMAEIVSTNFICFQQLNINEAMETLKRGILEKKLNKYTT